MWLARWELVVAFSLLISVATSYAEEAWESETAATCSQNAWTLTVLGAIGVGVILVLGGATISHNELYYRNPWWRLSWWASCLSLLGGIVLFKVYCGSPLN
jgi:hypothetical protein